MTFLRKSAGVAVQTNLGGSILFPGAEQHQSYPGYALASLRLAGCRVRLCQAFILSIVSCANFTDPFFSLLLSFCPSF